MLQFCPPEEKTDLTASIHGGLLHCGRQPCTSKDCAPYKLHATPDIVEAACNCCKRTCDGQLAHLQIPAI